MKHSTNASSFHTNLLQALQKNKVIQGKLTECQHSHYIKLLKDMQTYHLKEKYNRELLYTWKKESYVRQMKKDLQEYQQQCSGVRDDYYEHQAQKLGSIICGQQTLVIPPSEEERRVNLNVKYQQFLKTNPLQASVPMHGVKSVDILTEGNNSDKEREEKEAEINARSLEETWKHIYAQSAVTSRRKQNNMFPNIHRSATINTIRRNRSLAKSQVSSSKISVAPNVPITTSPNIIHPLSDDKLQQLPIKSSLNGLESPDDIEPLLMTSETLDKHNRTDLLRMRSVRRPRKNPSELNLVFETRKRIYQINKQALDFQLYQRKCQLQQNLRFDRRKPILSINHVEKLLDNITEKIPKKQDDDNDKQQSDQIIL